MASLTKALAAVGNNGNVYGLALTLARNPASHMAAGVPLFLSPGRPASLPVRRRLDEPHLDGTSRLWSHRLRHARIDTNEAQMRKRRGEGSC